MKTAKKHHIRQAVFAILAALCWLASPVLAADTDIYTSTSSKQNCEILMDNSLSMTFGVYDNNIDYGLMYDYLYTKGSSPSGGTYSNGTNTYIYDDTTYSKTSTTPNPLWGHHYERYKIYLISGPIGLGLVTVDGKELAFTGDAGDPSYSWNITPYNATTATTGLIDTHSFVDSDGNLSTEAGYRITISTADGNPILLDTDELKLGQSVPLHKYQTLYNSSIVDSGFGGLLNAPGFYFSGFKAIGTGSDSHTIATANAGATKATLYYFVTGNWLNMQAVYNLKYKSNNVLVWNTEAFPTAYQSQWPETGVSIDFPLDAPAGLTSLYPVSATQSVTTNSPSPAINVDTSALQIYFGGFDLKSPDSLLIKNASTGATLATLNSSNFSAGNWSPVLNTGNISFSIVAAKRNGSNSGLAGGQGIYITKIKYLHTAGGLDYKMQNRMEVAKEAMLFVVNLFTRKIDWGLSSFTKSGSTHVIHGLNPSDQDGGNQGLPNAIDTLTPAEPKTPLMEALQYVWVEEFQKSNPAFQSKSKCRKNYILTVTDGFPRLDSLTNIIHAAVSSAPDFGDAAGHDSVTWPQDPSFYTTPLPVDYYDDVAAWIYNHSWRSEDLGEAVTSHAESDANLRTHNISFGAAQPMLEYASSKAGGEYIVANSKVQLQAAFYSMAMMMSEAVSFTAPVVSVDAANKIQSGEDLYMGLFLPISDNYWAGNLKKFKLGNGTTRPDLFMIYDARNQPALDSTGQFKDNLAEFFDDYNSVTGTVTATDANDGDSNFDSADIKEDGVGQILLKRVTRYFDNHSDYWNRPIYTTIDGTTLVPFDQSFPPENLGLTASDTATRDKLVNFMHGYTYDANTDGTPVAVRPWILGSIIHSRPVVVDYFDTSVTTLPLKKRFIAVGSNDGMLHVFADTMTIDSNGNEIGTLDSEDSTKSENGKEMFAFIPMDILEKIKTMPTILGTVNDTVDGLITLYRDQDSTSPTYRNPKSLIFGERRGGGSFWSLDVSAPNLNAIDPQDWKIRWQYTHPEIVQSWSEVKQARVPYMVDAVTGERSYKDVAIFTGGYDPKEDNYPDSSGNNPSSTPAAATDKGRGIFVVDIDNPSTVTKTLGVQILPFTATYGTTLSVPSGGATQVIPDMQFSFPATPTVVTATDQYMENGAVTYKENVLRSLYALDIYANLFKTGFSFKVENTSTTTTPHWQIQSAGWDTVTKIFKANPGSTSSYAGATGTLTTDTGKKTFYPPSVSWGGSKGYFEASNYQASSATFGNLTTMASLFFGTGDREHPLNPAAIRNRFYALYDDASITATNTAGTTLKVPPLPKTELNLLNLTCDELGQNTIITSCYLAGASCSAASVSADMKKYLKTLLTDDVLSATPPQLEYQVGINAENDKKGWYIVLDDQGNAAKCPYVSYPTTIQTSSNTSHDNHVKEQVLSPSLLYYGILYFTTYQPADTSDPCSQQGNGFAYALDYLDGSAVYDLNFLSTSNIQDGTDRYKKFTGIYGIPSGFTVVLRDGHAAAMASMGGAIVGPGPDPLKPFEISTPGLGLEIFYWRDSNSLQP
ncbi:MAG: hypothetical protein V2B20_04300 [Pseudomonadota bacterium]